MSENLMDGSALKNREGMKVACPLCGKALPVRIVELRGSLRYTILCRSCKRMSEVEIRDIQ